MGIEKVVWETLPTWEAFEAAVAVDHPKDWEPADCIYIEGAFNPAEEPYRYVRPESRATHEAVLKAIVSNYQYLTVRAIQTPEHNPQDSSMKWEGRITIADGGGLLGVLGIYIFHPRNAVEAHELIPTSNRFYMNLPIGRLQTSTIKALAELWPLVIGIEHTTQQEGKDPEVFGTGAAVLVHDHQVVATGLPALARIGFVPQRQVYHTIGGMIH
jgi:hypothetical protein